MCRIPGLRRIEENASPVHRVVRTYVRLNICHLGFQAPNEAVCDGIAVTKYARPSQGGEDVNQFTVILIPSHEADPSGRVDDRLESRVRASEHVHLEQSHRWARSVRRGGLDNQVATVLQEGSICRWRTRRSHHFWNLH